ncbi:MAG: hypothetical protein L0Y66_20735, partial [Myxococcaceae bacterium]|nr:hypothetical protein [Myxococcaceae bacterium]
MAVTSTTSSVDYTGTGAVSAYAVPFRFLADAHLVVKRTVSGVTTTLTLGPDYTVTGAGASGGGTVTLASALAVAATLSIKRTVPLTQPTAFRTQGTFSPAAHENAFDMLAMAAQQEERERLAVETRTTSLEGRATAVEGRATTLEGRATNLEQSTLPVGTQTVVATGSTTARLLAARFSDVVNVKDFGAVCIGEIGAL